LKRILDIQIQMLAWERQEALMVLLNDWSTETDDRERQLLTM